MTSLPTHGAAGGLCDTCASLDVQHILTAAHSNEEFELTTFSDLEAKSARCPACRTMTAAVMNGPRKLKGLLRPDDQLIMVAKATGTLHCRSDAPNGPMRINRLQIMTDDCNDVGDLLVCGDDSALFGQPAIYHGRPVLKTQVNYGIIAEWISGCNSQHPQCSTSSAQLRSTHLSASILLIDVQEQCLRYSAGNEKFAALSYCWGEAKNFLTKRDNVNRLREEAAFAKITLPATIRDAITLTSRIGLRYLWVDALCIIQDDPAHKAVQLPQMHRIYGDAAVTIVAVEGVHADTELPGVQPGSRDLNQAVVSVSDVRIMARLGYLDVTMNLSRYNTRGWTYQESCLSQRLLYLTSKGAIFVCKESIRTEEFVLEDGECGQSNCQDHTSYLSTAQRNFTREFRSKTPERTKGFSCTCKFSKRSRFQRGLPPPGYGHDRAVNVDAPLDRHFIGCEDCLAFERSTEAEFHVYRDLVRSYTHRQIKFPQDRTAAFAGIVSLLEEKYQSTFVSSIPEKFIDSALLWRAQRPRLDIASVGNELAGVPSWSWTSRLLSVGYPGDIWLTSEVDWYLLDQQDSLRRSRSLKVMGTCIPMRDDYERLVTKSMLSLHGELNEQHTCEVSLSCDAKWCPKTRHYSLVGWCQMVASFTVCDGFLCQADRQLIDTAKVPIWFDAPQDFKPSEHHPVEVLLLSRSHHQSVSPQKPAARWKLVDWELSRHTLNLLVVERRGNVARRLGIVGIVDVGLWQKVKKEWALIKLI